MRHLIFKHYYFIFLADGEILMNLWNHHFFTKVSKAESYCIAVNSLSSKFHKDLGLPHSYKLVYRTGLFIQRHSHVLKIFKNYFGSPHIQIMKNDIGQPIKMRYQGIPTDCDISKCDLSLIAGIPDMPFLSNADIKALSKESTLRAQVQRKTKMA